MPLLTWQRRKAHSQLRVLRPADELHLALDAGLYPGPVNTIGLESVVSA